MKRSLNLRKVILALSKAAKNIEIKEKKLKEDKQTDVQKRIETRQKKVNKLRNLEKARLKKEYVSLLKKQLELLEKEYKKLKRKNKHKKSDLDKIKNKIDMLKDKVKDL